MRTNDAHSLEGARCRSPILCAEWHEHFVTYKRHTQHTMDTPQPLLDVTVGIDTGPLSRVRWRGLVPPTRPRGRVRPTDPSIEVDDA